MDISFSGAGFMGCYYFGVVDCLQKYVPRERINRVAGASAGSLIAAYYLMDLPMAPCLRAIIDLTEDIKRRTMGVFDRSNQIVDVLPRMLDDLFPQDAHKRVSGRLFVCMTRLKDMKKIIVSEFETRQDLIDALNCSSFIPVWSGNHVSTYKGVKHIDGGFSDNLPIFDEHTIRICCFAGQTDISPYDSKTIERLSVNILNTPVFFNLSNMKRFRLALFPPTVKQIIAMLERGFHDAKQFILENDLIQCDRCYNSLRPDEQNFPSIHVPIITPTGTPAASPGIDGNDLMEALKFRFPTSATPNKIKRLELRRNTVQADTSFLAVPERFTSTTMPLPSCPPSPNLDRHCIECIRMRQAARVDHLEKEVRETAANFIKAREEEALSGRTSAANATGATNPSNNKQNINDNDNMTSIANNSDENLTASDNANDEKNNNIRSNSENSINSDMRAEYELGVDKSTKGKRKLTRSLTSPLRWIRQIGSKSQYSYTFEDLGEQHQHTVLQQAEVKC